MPIKTKKGNEKKIPQASRKNNKSNLVDPENYLSDKNLKKFTGLTHPGFSSMMALVIFLEPEEK